MPPKLLSEDGRQIVIRPLCYVPEREILRYANARAFPIILLVRPPQLRMGLPVSSM